MLWRALLSFLLLLCWKFWFLAVKMESMPAPRSSKAADTYGRGLSVSERGLLLVSLLLALSCRVAVDSFGSRFPLYLLFMDPFERGLLPWLPPSCPFSIEGGGIFDQIWWLWLGSRNEALPLRFRLRSLSVITYIYPCMPWSTSSFRKASSSE